MSMIKLQRSFEERRNNLIEKLENNRSDLDLSQQHQIYGAVKEIEKFLKSIEYYRTLDAESAFDIELSQEKEWPIVKRSQRILKNTASGIGRGFKWTFVHFPVMVGKSVRGQYEEYKAKREVEAQVRREVEKRMREQQ